MDVADRLSRIECWPLLVLLDFPSDRRLACVTRLAAS
jgi:hypothetical protein